MHSVIQIFLLLPIFILTTTTANATFDSDNNDVIIREPTSSHSAPPPHPTTSPFDTVLDMNRTTYLALAMTCLDETDKLAWYLRGRGKPNEGSSKELQEKDGDTSNDDDSIDHPDHYPYDVCYCADFLKHFNEDPERDWIPQSYWTVIDEYCDSISNQTIAIVTSAPLAERVLEPQQVLTKRMVKLGPAVGARMPAVAARRPAVAARRPAVAARRPAVAARRPAVAARRPTLEARMPTVATRRGRVPPIVGSVVWVYIATQPMPTTPPNAPLRCVCREFLWNGCPCLEMTLEAQEAWRN
ncbi:hypothetical protein JMJ35_006414 [Cladonia borealis]|uniref:Uncharacterized protein n=1 Tax=Cladonia borealis TaxID=184061 RepID=A0AA39QX42_9LECA|nr:hypothetical protein JMJ35_006414 [Cladonia borealis]